MEEARFSELLCEMPLINQESLRKKCTAIGLK